MFLLYDMSWIAIDKRKKMKMESLVGKNGLVWIKTEELSDLMFIRRLLQNAAFMSRDGVEFEIDQFLQSKTVDQQ